MIFLCFGCWPLDLLAGNEQLHTFPFHLPRVASSFSTTDFHHYKSDHKPPMNRPLSLNLLLTQLHCQTQYDQMVETRTAREATVVSGSWHHEEGQPGTDLPQGARPERRHVNPHLFSMDPNHGHENQPIHHKDLMGWFMIYIHISLWWIGWLITYPSFMRINWVCFHHSSPYHLMFLF